MNRHKNLSFYIESLVLLFFLLAALVVLIRVFGAAQALGIQARQKTDAALILQTVSSQFSARSAPFDTAVAEAESAGQAQVDFLCDGQGNVCSDGAYRVAVDLWSEARKTGTMVYAQICITQASDQTGTALGELSTSVYCPHLSEEAHS